MADILDPKHTDKRTVERYIRSGQLEEKAHERSVKGLPDLADKAVSVDTLMLDEDFEDEADEADEATDTE